jgi:gluconate 5-dehydrogenase
MKPNGVLITGTTSGVGRALLEHYVKRGVPVISVNRRRLPELESRYPQVRFECVDVRSAEAVAKLILDLSLARELPGTFILNAGTNGVDNDDSLQLDVFQTVLDTNLYGVLNFVAPLTRLPKARVPRHVVAVSSMARYIGNPYGLGYFVSKKALTACFEVWSQMYASTDLVFQQVMLGPVPTSIHTMAEQFPSWMVRLRDAFSGSPDATARAIASFALTRKSKLFHPWRAVPLYLGMWLGRALIPGFFRGRKTLAGRARRTTGAGEADGEAEGEDEKCEA